MKSNWSFFVMHLVSFKNIVWNSLVMQWLGFGTATAVATVWSPVPALQADSLPTELWGKPIKILVHIKKKKAY